MWCRKWFNFNFTVNKLSQIYARSNTKKNNHQQQNDTKIPEKQHENENRLQIFHSAEHDSNLQRQEVRVNNHEGKLVLFFWRAICDERKGFLKKVVVLAYTQNGTA